MKKGQITPFIIVGIVLLVSISIVSYLNVKEAKEIPTDDIISDAPSSSEASNVGNFIRSCVTSVADEGLRLAGEHGGYIYLDKLDADVSTPTEGNSLDFIPNSGLLVPYWYYMSSPSSCQGGCSFQSMMPPLCKSQRDGCLTYGQNSIEDQLTKYLGENTKGCLAEFSSLSQFGIEVQERSEPKFDVTLRDKSVLIRIKYPITISKGESQTDVTDFSVNIMSDMKEMYDMAYEFTNFESENCFIGLHTQNYLSYFMGIGDKQIPPVHETTVAEPSYRVWALESVKQQLKTRFAAAIKLIGVFNTANFDWPQVEDPDDPYYTTKQGVLDRRVFRPFSKYHDAQVILNYLPTWNPYVSITPSEGGLLKPTDIGTKAPFAELFAYMMQVSVYEFQYHYSFPVVVDIVKEDVTGKDQIFRFALETNVRSNRCYGPDIDITHTQSVPTMICDPLHANREAKFKVKEYVRDAFGLDTLIPVKDVKVTHFAGVTCMLGYTDDAGQLDTKYGGAHGSQFSLTKQGYTEKIIDEATLKSGEDIILWKPVVVNVSLKHFKLNRDGTLPTVGANLREGEQVLISIEKLDEPKMEPQFVSFTDSSETDMKLRLLPGTYKIDADYFDNNKITLPKRCFHICEDSIWNCFSDDSWDSVNLVPISECSDICRADPVQGCCGDADDWNPKEESDVSLMGGADLSNNTITWKVDNGAHYRAKNIELRVLSMRDPDCITEENCVIPGCIGYGDEMGRLDAYYKQYVASLKPRIIWE